MLKKITAILMMISMILVTSCASGPQLMDFIDNSGGPQTLGGITLYFTANFGPEDPSNTSDLTPFLGYTQNTTFYDAAIERVAQVEKDLDVNIEQSPEGRELNDIVYLLASGDGKLDAVIGVGVDYIGGLMPSLYKAFTPMSSVSQYIDIQDSAKWGDPKRLEMFAWDGEIYGVIPNYWPELQFSSSDFIVIPNVDYIESIGETDPRDFFENGVWTLEKMEELIPLYAQYSDVKEEIIYGLSANDRHLYEMLVQYYGADWAQKNANGKWEMGSLSEGGRLAAEKLHDYMTGELSDLILFDKVGAQTYRWGQKQVAMSLLHTICLTEPYALIPQVGFEYAVLPFPSQDGKSIFGQFERNVEAIMITSFSMYSEESAKVLNAIYEPFADYNDETSLIERYNSTLFFDERDTEIMLKLSESVRLLPSNSIGELNIKITEELGKFDAAEVLSRYSSLLQNILETELIPVKETMEKIFPGYND